MFLFNLLESTTENTNDKPWLTWVMPYDVLPASFAEEKTAGA